MVSRGGLLLASAGLAAVVHLGALAAGAPALALIVKPLPVALLAVWVLVGGRAASARFLAAGLLLSAFGDLLLGLPGRFIAGLAVFLVAHLTYAAGFFAVRRAVALARLAPFALFGVGMLAFLRPGLGEMAVPVAIYVAAIVTMMWRSAACLGATTLPPRAAAAGLVGALLFAASDSLIALDRFHAPIAGVVVPIMALYWLGQLGIAASAIGVGESASAREPESALSE